MKCSFRGSRLMVIVAVMITMALIGTNASAYEIHQMGSQRY
ncbi:hypothetical protein [Halomonas llamarensis]|nr:hypothetical protein [Halomonas llamarensis]